MNRYIITEEDIIKFSKLIDVLEQTGRTSDDADFDVMYAWRGIIEEVKSCPYQSERNPYKNVVGIHCPLCNWHQIVPIDEWFFQSTEGHGHTCGSDKCPSHTYMVLDDFQSERDKVLDEVQYKLKQKIQSAPSLHTLILDMKDVDSVFIELRQAGEP